MGKEAQPKEESQTGSASHKSEDAATPKEMTQANNDVKTRCTAVRKFLAEYWLWLKEHRYEVLSGFLVAVVAVFIASQLTQWLEQRALDENTKRKLQLVYLEFGHNQDEVKMILERYEDSDAIANSFIMSTRRPNSTAVLAAFQDTNVLNVLPFHMVSMLRSYMRIISRLDQSLQVYIGVLGSTNYRSTPMEKQGRQSVRDLALVVYAMSFVLREELKEYSVTKSVDIENSERIWERVDFIEGEALKGEFYTPKEQTGTHE